jgi:5'-nucleotidase (lipoprotein e(P4) family)
MPRLTKAAALLVFVVAGCQSTPATMATPAAAQPQSQTLPRDVRWFRNSAEYRAITTQTYRVAGERLSELARGSAPREWAVIFDADETVLDNSEYQRRRAVLDSGYTDATWAAWVREEAAPPVPGAVDFTKRVHELGGRVVIVTNRAESLCTQTRSNLAKVGLAPDVVLCMPPGESDKNPRFQRVQQGTAVPGVPALRVVAWVGDNIQDFPSLTQDARHSPAALAEFGVKYFVLPNPMYGSWERNTSP